ncbi:hypothetical protein GCM10023088_54690 [Actinomadura verrucosospora]
MAETPFPLRSAPGAGQRPGRRHIPAEAIRFMADHTCSRGAREIPGAPHAVAASKPG